MKLDFNFDRPDFRPTFYTRRSWKHTPNLTIPRDMEQYADDVAMGVANLSAEDCEKNALSTYHFNMLHDRELDNRDFEEVVQLAMDIMEMETRSSRNRRPEDFIDSSVQLATRMKRAELIDRVRELEREIPEGVRREAIGAVRKLQEMERIIEDYQREMSDDDGGRDVRGRDDRDYRGRASRGYRDYRDDRNDRDRGRGRDIGRDRDRESGRFGGRDERGRGQGATRSYDGGAAESVTRNNRTRRDERAPEPVADDSGIGTIFYDRHTGRGGAADGYRRPEPAREERVDRSRYACRNEYAQEVAREREAQERLAEGETNREVAAQVMRRGTERFRETVASNERESQEISVRSDDLPQAEEKSVREVVIPILVTVNGESEMEFMEHNSIYDPVKDTPEQPMAQAYKKLLTLGQSLQFGGLIEEQVSDLIDTQPPGKLTQEPDMAAAVDAVMIDAMKKSVASAVESAPEARRIYRSSTIVSNTFVGRTTIGDLMRRMKRATSLQDLHKNLRAIHQGLESTNPGADPSGTDIAVALQFIDKYFTKELNRYMTDVMALATPGTNIMTSWLETFQDLPAAIEKNFHPRQVSSLAAFCSNLFRAFSEAISPTLKADEDCYEMLGIDRQELGILSIPRVYHFTVLPFTGKEMGYNEISAARINGTNAPLFRAMILSKEALEEATSVSAATQIIVLRDRQVLEIHRDPLNSQEFLISPIKL